MRRISTTDYAIVLLVFVEVIYLVKAALFGMEDEIGLSKTYSMYVIPFAMATFSAAFLIGYAYFNSKDRPMEKADEETTQHNIA